METQASNHDKKGRKKITQHKYIVRYPSSNDWICPRYWAARLSMYSIHCIAYIFILCRMFEQAVKWREPFIWFLSSHKIKCSKTKSFAISQNHFGYAVHALSLSQFVYISVWLSTNILEYYVPGRSWYSMLNSTEQSYCLLVKFRVSFCIANMKIEFLIIPCVTLRYSKIYFLLQNLFPSF